ncbi:MULTISPECIES: hypothetical protein [Rhizobium]|uniref:hypothetical protein n=1 Tax=Rhizobium TaxID=379 RepID=UPI001B329738|nr:MULTISPECIES: hypothetical protein [Rhizobium]MBX4906842.1 hypothetical protein [Rhizobium bangladeshense]MBX5217328.1 hypothetical protein [Rhizobium sp. NLR9a]MBX5234248.1 hypothetical protein [Rhizobium sp. NLR4a]MBX5239832.1 hypothetical protein [Rhizobium sp. NLR22b]MBX5245052.1 hypothetical protein [Rhizobium sp. NLR3b]
MLIRLFNSKNAQKTTVCIGAKKIEIYAFAYHLIASQPAFATEGKAGFFDIATNFLRWLMFFHLSVHQIDIKFPADAPVSAKSTSFFDKTDFKLARYLHHIREREHPCHNRRSGETFSHEKDRSDH